MILRPLLRIRALVALVGALGVFAFLLVAVSAGAGPVLRFDRAVVASLHRLALAHPVWTGAMRAVSLVGAPATWWVILTPVFVILLLRRQFRVASWLFACPVGSAALNALVKSAVHSARPAVDQPVAAAAGWSFPSGHAQAATVACLVLAILARPQLSTRSRCTGNALALLVVASVALSRVALGVHYPSDVAGGIALGVAWVLLVSLLAARGTPQSCARGATRAGSSESSSSVSGCSLRAKSKDHSDW